MIGGYPEIGTRVAQKKGLPPALEFFSCNFLVIWKIKIVKSLSMGEGIFFYNKFWLYPIS